MSAVQANINVHLTQDMVSKGEGHRCVKCRKVLHWGDPGIVWNFLACGPLSLCPTCARSLISSLVMDYHELCDKSNFGGCSITPLPDLTKLRRGERV